MLVVYLIIVNLVENSLFLTTEPSIRNQNDEVHPQFVMTKKWKWQQIASTERQHSKKQTGKQSSIRAVKSENWGPRLLPSQPHSFWLTFFCRPFRCSIRINSTASEAAQSISKSADSAGRVSISHGVTLSTWGDLRSSTVQMQWCSVSQLKTLLRKGLFITRSAGEANALMLFS